MARIWQPPEHNRPVIAGGIAVYKNGGMGVYLEVEKGPMKNYKVGYKLEMQSLQMVKTAKKRGAL